MDDDVDASMLESILKQAEMDVMKQRGVSKVSNRTDLCEGKKKRKKWKMLSLYFNCIEWAACVSKELFTRCGKPW